MSAHIRALHPAIKPAAMTPLLARYGALPLVLALALLLAGCTDAPRSPAAGPNPTDPGARVPHVDYRSTIGSYKSQRPVSPGPWREQNEQATPAPKSGH